MSRTEVKISDLDKVIMDALEDYKDGAKKVIAEVLPVVGQETAQELQSLSRSKFKGSGAYAKGWKAQRDTRKRSKDSTAIVVLNKTHYRLTHLLENGHAKVNGGRVEGRPHISEAEKNAIDKSVKRIKDRLEHLK